jgi:glucose/arabinose dehydrogenase
MRVTTGAILGSIALVLSACGGGGSTTTTGGQSDDDHVVETVPAAVDPIVLNNELSWSFSPVESNLPVNINVFTEMPVASNGGPARWNDMATLGDRLFVVDEQDGRVYEISDSKVNLWFDIRASMIANTGRDLNIANPFHGGVRGIAFHPDFSSNGKFYASLMEDRPANPGNHVYLSDAAAIDADSVLVEWTVDIPKFTVEPDSYREVFRVGVPQNDHPIKKIAFNPVVKPGDADYGLLYIAHGDGSQESNTAIGGQGNDALGKILRINPLVSGTNTYSIPADNPFVDNPSMLDEVYTLGHRNPHHLTFTTDGQLLVAEAGRDNIDEVNLIVSGADYGWSQREGAYVHLDQGTLFDGIAMLPANDAVNDFTYPVIQFGHYGTVGSTFIRQALAGGSVVENGSELDGHYFYVDFPRSGDVFHSHFQDIQAAVTKGDPQALTIAKSYKASITFDHDNNPDTKSIPSTLSEIIRTTGNYDNSDRLDIRFGQGPSGELYIMNKRNNVIYLVTNSLP